MPVSTWKEIELSQRHLFFQSSFFPSLTALLSTPSLFSPIIYLLTICIHLFEGGRQTLLNEDVSHCFNLHVIPVCVIESSEAPPLPNPILESHESQSFSPLPRIPILARALPAFCVLFPDVLNPSLLQFGCNRPGGLTQLFHASFPNDVGRYWPSAINEYTDSAVLLITISLVATSPGTFMPTQILEKDVFQ